MTLIFFDPEDAQKHTEGTHIKLTLHEPSPRTEIDTLLNCMTERELHGYDEYDGWSDGYPEADFHSPDCDGNLN